MKKLYLSLLLALGANGVNAAEPHRGIIQGSYTTGDADYTISGTKYDGDLDGTGISGRFYPTEDIYVSLSMGSAELDLVGTTFDIDTTSFGGGLVFGERIDYIAGEGSEQRLGFDYTDTETKVNSTTTSSDSTDIEYAVEGGLGNGVTGGFYFSTDTDDLFSSNSYSFALYKSLTDNIVFGGAYEFADTEADNGDKAEAIGISLGIGFVF